MQCAFICASEIQMISAFLKVRAHGQFVGNMRCTPPPLARWQGLFAVVSWCYDMDESPQGAAMKQSFYGKLRAQSYDIGTDVSNIASFYLAEWQRLGQPMPLLEPMCGTGLNLEFFQRAGIACDGLDASEHMLAICQQRLAGYGLNTKLFHQHLEVMQVPQQYGMLFIPGGSLGHLYEPTVLQQALGRMHTTLQSGGWLVVDTRPPAYMAQFPADGATDVELDEYADGSTVLTTGYWQHLDNGRIIRKWNKKERFVNDLLTTTEVFDYRERLFEADELRSYLRNAGFDDITITKAYERETMPTGKDGIVFTCRKPIER
jgi:ubiquinone/menaquinone biosynthesis C-methylase UbiE